MTGITRTYHLTIPYIKSLTLPAAERLLDVLKIKKAEIGNPDQINFHNAQIIVKVRADHLRYNYINEEDYFAFGEYQFTFDYQEDAEPNYVNSGFFLNSPSDTNKKLHNVEQGSNQSERSQFPNYINVNQFPGK